MSKTSKLKEHLEKWSEEVYAPLLKKMELLEKREKELENENYRLRKQNIRLNNHIKQLKILLLKGGK